MNPRPVYYVCHHCTALHPACDDHSYRTGQYRQQLDALYGANGWNEIRHSEVAAWRAGVAPPTGARTIAMNDYSTVRLYGGPRANYDLVWFEDRKQWFIRSTDRATEIAEYSDIGYETKREAAQAFEGIMTYVSEPPGKS